MQRELRVHSICDLERPFSEKPKMFRGCVDFPHVSRNVFGCALQHSASILSASA